MIRKTGLFIHPIWIFILSTITLATSLFLYIYWYIGVSAELEAIIRRYSLDPDQFFEARTWVVILVLSLLVGVILVGIIIILMYHLKTVKLYSLQQSFINNFTHELKTPVTSLRLYLETFVKHDIKRKEQERYFQFMLQDIDRLSGNISSILNLAKIESNVYEGVPLPADIPALIDNFLAQNRHLFENVEIRVTRPAEEQLVCAVIVPLFEMILMNLLTNACKYNVSGKPRIDISFAYDKRNLIINFADNGIGIKRDDRKRIFKKFYQANLHDERIRSGGSGIGLYLVSQIAKFHNGRITAYSEGPGKGSTFSLMLPCAQKDGQPYERIDAETHTHN